MSESSELEPNTANFEHMIANAYTEIESCRRLLNDLPEIYEDKFRQKVCSVAQEIRFLFDERKALQGQMVQVLNRAAQAPVLPPARQVEPLQVVPKRWSDLRLPRFSSPSPESPTPPPRRTLLVGIGASVVLVGGGAVLLALAPNRMQPLSKPEPPSAQSRSSPSLARLRLQARGGQSWVLVEDLKGRKVLDAILEPGQRKDLPIGAGLRLRSGRPDLLFAGVDQQTTKPLGGVSDLDWMEIRP